MAYVLLRAGVTMSHDNDTTATDVLLQKVLLNIYLDVYHPCHRCMNPQVYESTV